MVVSIGYLIPVGPKNPNQLKSLTLFLVMIILERSMFLYGYTAREQGPDHAIRRLDPSHLDLDLVPVPSFHADGTHRLATPRGSLPTHDRHRRGHIDCGTVSTPTENAVVIHVEGLRAHPGSRPRGL